MVGGEEPAASVTRGTSLSAQFSGPELTRYRMLFNGARAGDVGLVRGLLTDGMDVNLSGPRGATPLHIAARFGQLQMVELLLSFGADRGARDERGSSPSDKARAVGMASIAKKLEQQHPEVISSHRFDSSCRRLLEAAHRGDSMKLSQLVAEHPGVIYKKGPRGASALHVAARYGHTEAVRMLLRLGADPGVTDDSGNTAAVKASQLKHTVKARGLGRRGGGKPRDTCAG